MAFGDQNQNSFLNPAQRTPVPSFNLPTAFQNQPIQNTALGNISPSQFSLSPNSGFNSQTTGGILDPQSFVNGSQFPTIPGVGGNTPGAGTNPDFFDPTGGSRFLIPGLEALTGVANYANSRDLLNLGKDQFNFAKDQSNRDFSSQSQVFNTNLEDSQRGRLQSSGQFDTSTPEGKAAFDTALNDFVAENKIQDKTL